MTSILFAKRRGFCFSQFVLIFSSSLIYLTRGLSRVLPAVSGIVVISVGLLGVVGVAGGVGFDGSSVSTGATALG